MSSFIKDLYEVMMRNPLQRKVLISSSFAQGNLWLEQTTRYYGKVLNVSVQTVESIALVLVKPKLFSNRLEYLPAVQSQWIIHCLMSDLSKEPDSFITNEMLTSGIVSAFHKSLCEIRNAQLKASQIHESSFVNPIKGLYIKQLLEKYENELTNRRLVDFSGLVDHISPVKHNATYMFSEHANWNKTEQQIMSMVAKQGVEIKGDELFTSTASSFPVERTEISHASGKRAELREAFRTLLEQKLPLDGVEVIASNYEGDCAGIYSITESLGISCTFSQGVSVLFTKAGRAAMAFIQWIESNYNIDFLTAALRQGEIRFKNVAEGITQGVCLKVMEEAGIGWGRERYSLLARLAETSDKEANQQTAAILNTEFEKLFDVLSGESYLNPYGILKSLHYFMKHFGVTQNEQDTAVMESIKVRMERAALGKQLEMTLGGALQYVKEELESIRVKVSTLPQPGRLHISSLSDGGQSGREVTFLLGMDEHNWSLSVRQDPVLLNDERNALSGDLHLSHEKIQQQSKERLSRLGMIRGRVYLSFTSYDMADNKEVSPAYELLQILRNKEFNQELDFSHLFASLGAPSQMMSDHGAVIDAADYWLTKLTTSNGLFSDGKQSILSAYAHLNSGQRAALLRHESKLGEYDGLIDVSSHSIQYTDMAASHLSASKLELFAACPMKFFYQEILKVRPKESAAFDRDVWLGPADKGSLIHGIFQTYLHEVSSTGTVIHNENRLRQITEDSINIYRERIPAPSTHILEKECQSILEDVAVFFKTEMTRTSLPRYFELDITEGGEPFRLEFSEDLGIYLKGFVDRVDEIAPHHYKIIDYKTGNPRKFIDAQFFEGGAQLQHALYALVVEQWLRQTGADSKATVSQASYYFPTVKGKGEEVIRSQTRREDLTKLIHNMVQSMEEGTFPPTHNPNNCKWCDYKNVCGDHAETVKETRALEENLGRTRGLLEVSQLG